jgi:hypothetical protein
MALSRFWFEWEFLLPTIVTNSVPVHEDNLAGSFTKSDLHRTQAKSQCDPDPVQTGLDRLKSALVENNGYLLPHHQSHPESQ